MSTLKHHLTLSLVLAAIVIALALSVRPGAALADSIDVRNPFDTAAAVTSDWTHGAGYAERSLDLIYSGGRATANAPAISHVNNLNIGKNVYYDVFDYGSPTGCHGVKHVMYEIPVGGGSPAYVGTVIYLHIYGYSTGGYVYIGPGSTEYRTVGWVSSGDCGTQPHLHHGRTTSSSGPLQDAYWLGVGTALTNYEITLYKP